MGIISAITSIGWLIALVTALIISFIVFMIINLMAEQISKKIPKAWLLIPSVWTFYYLYQYFISPSVGIMILITYLVLSGAMIFVVNMFKSTFGVFKR